MFNPHPLMKTLTRFALATVLAFSLAACGGDDAAPTTDPVAPATTTEAPAPEPAPAPEAPPAFDGPAMEVTLQPVGNEMQYATTEITAQPGQTVVLTFENTADNPAMSHNVVFLAAGTDVNAFGRAAMSAAETEYIPSDMESAVIAHTSMAAPGETVTVEFTAPAAGTYTYVCTFPGHFMTMQGTLTVASAS